MKNQLKPRLNSPELKDKASRMEQLISQSVITLKGSGYDKRQKH